MQLNQRIRYRPCVYILSVHSRRDSDGCVLQLKAGEYEIALGEECRKYSHSSSIHKYIPSILSVHLNLQHVLLSPNKKAIVYLSVLEFD